jgi:hypothetical protein
MKNLLTTFLFIAFISQPAWLSASLLDGSMVKIGQGKAYYLGFITVYNASLYSDESERSVDILDADISKCLHLEYTVDIGRKDFIMAADTVLQRQFTPDQLNLASSEIQTLHDGYRDVQEGDSYTLCYDKNNGETTLTLNSDILVTITSPLFSQIYFSIWLGDNKPLDDDLREDLLAGWAVN